MLMVFLSRVLSLRTGCWRGVKGGWVYPGSTSLGYGLPFVLVGLSRPIVMPNCKSAQDDVASDFGEFQAF
jgi:hypothetical protein